MAKYKKIARNTPLTSPLVEAMLAITHPQIKLHNHFLKRVISSKIPNKNIGETGSHVGAMLLRGKLLGADKMLAFGDGTMAEYYNTCPCILISHSADFVVATSLSKEATT